MKEGEDGSTAFLIQSGHVEVSVNKNDKKVVLAALGIGEIFGEMALVFDETRTATVQALEDCNLVVITRQALKYKLDRSDPTVRAIVPMLMKRVIQSNNTLLQKQSDIKTLEETVHNIYDNLHHAVPPSQKKTLENNILPKLEAFMDSVRSFHKNYIADEDD